MKLIKWVAIFSLIVSGCVTNYNSIKKPVAIPFQGDYDRSAHKKYEFLEDNFGKRNIAWKLLSRKVFEKNKKVYDRMIIRLLPDGPNLAVYFDMSDVANDLISTMTIEDKPKE